MKKYFCIILILSLCFSVFALDPDLEVKVVFEEGLSYAQVTRVEALLDRSNFVRENMMIGAFFSTKTVGLPLVDFKLDISAYYPFYQAFNGMQQHPKNVVNYAFDGYLAAYQGFLPQRPCHSLRAQYHGHFRYYPAGYAELSADYRANQ